MRSSGSTPQVRPTTTATAASCSTCCAACWPARPEPPPVPRVSPDHLLARRQQILDGARAAFARHGYEGATVRVLEEEIGLSRGAIFHHFADKDAVFMALAGQDAAAMAATVAREGLVAVMRDMIAAPDAGWLGTQLEVSRRARTDP